MQIVQTMAGCARLYLFTLFVEAGQFCGNSAHTCILIQNKVDLMNFSIYAMVLQFFRKAICMDGDGLQNGEKQDVMMDTTGRRHEAMMASNSILVSSSKSCFVTSTFASDQNIYFILKHCTTGD